MKVEMPGGLHDSHRTTFDKLSEKVSFSFSQVNEKFRLIILCLIEWQNESEFLFLAFCLKFKESSK